MPGLWVSAAPRGGGQDRRCLLWAGVQNALERPTRSRLAVGGTSRELCRGFGLDLHPRLWPPGGTPPSSDGTGSPALRSYCDRCYDTARGWGGGGGHEYESDGRVAKFSVNTFGAMAPGERMTEEAYSPVMDKPLGSGGPQI